MKETRSRLASPAAVAAFALATAFGAPGCGDDGATPAGSGGAPGTTASSGSTSTGSTSTGQSEPVPFAGDAPTCEITDDTTAPAVCCPADKLRALPALANSVLDLSDAASIGDGTCGNYFSVPGERRAVLLSQDPADYPMKIVLPALSGPAPACLETCPIDVAQPPYTAFGVAIATGAEDAGNLIGGNTGRVLAISVPPPWFFVSGGCGDACPWPCLEGYQEFGVRSCYTMSYGDFGFATADPNAPSVEAVVELLDLSGQNAFDFAPGGCCLYDG